MSCSVAAKAAVSSADGTKLAAVTEEGVDVYATADGSKVRGSKALFHHCQCWHLTIQAMQVPYIIAALSRSMPSKWPAHCSSACRQRQMWTWCWCTLTCLSDHADPGVLCCCMTLLLQLASLSVSGVILVDWSRTGSFITTAQRPGKGPDGQQAKNIKVCCITVVDYDGQQLVSMVAVGCCSSGERSGSWHQSVPDVWGQWGNRTAVVQICARQQHCRHYGSNKPAAVAAAAATYTSAP